MDYELSDTDSGESAGDGGGSAGRPPRRPVGLLIGAVVALGALAAVLLVFGPPGDWTSPPAPEPSPTSAVPSASATSAGGSAVTDADGVRQDLPPSEGGLSVVNLCGPDTDGGRKVRVSFQVVNTGPDRVRLIDVQPRLPRPGLLKLTGVTAGGSCDDPGKERLDRYLPPGGRLIVTMRLRVLDDCPVRGPVGVTIRAGLRTGVRTLSYDLFADLSSLVFAGC